MPEQQPDSSAHEPRARGQILLRLARASLRRHLCRHLGPDIQSEGTGEPPVDREQAWLLRPAATFVTLRVPQARATDGWALRGCIGSLEASRALVDDVEANAVAAAVADPRFQPMAEAELDSVLIEVSLLSPLEPIETTTEEALLKMLRPGVDGLVLEYGRHRATFLPQVWRDLGDPRQFLGALKVKAGLSADFWAAEVSTWRYRVDKWIEISPFDAAGSDAG